MDLTFNAGNAITIASSILAFVWHWSRTQSAIEQIEECLREINTRERDQEIRVRALEINATRQDEKLLSILSLLQEIRAEFRKVAR